MDGCLGLCKFLVADLGLLETLDVGGELVCSLDYRVGFLIRLYVVTVRAP